MVHIYNGILLSHKKEWNNAICSTMDGPRDYHTKWSKSERERQMPYAITYMWNLKYDTSDWHSFYKIIEAEEKICLNSVYMDGLASG